MAEEETKPKETPKWRLYLRENDRGVRLLIALILLLSMATFLHFREVRIEVLEPDSIAPRYVVAQTDFEFLDEEATTKLKEKATGTIGSIYRLNIGTLQEKRREFEKEILSDPKWRSTIESGGFDALYNAVDGVEEFMRLTHFTDPITLQKLREMGFNVATFQAIYSAETGEALALPPEYWRKLSRQAVTEGALTPDAVRSVVDHFAQFGWMLEVDSYEEQSVREFIFAKIPNKYSRVKAGSPIIDQGQRVTKRHIDMMQGMKRTLSQKQSLWRPTPILGSLIFALIILSLGAFYFHANQKEFYYSTKKLALFATIVILTLVVAKVTEYALLHNVTHLIDDVRYPLFTPFAAILLTILIGPEIALFTTVFLSVIIGISLAFDHNRILVLNFITAIVAIISTRKLRKRKEVFGVCGKVWLATIPILIGYNFVENILWNVGVFTDIASALTFMTITAILVVGFLPILESIFHIMTDITLMEYMDPNNELLRRLSLEAPGTYQHCLVVGSLAEAAAQAIGAKGLFCRVSTLYHDIGKLMNPHYFTENQMGGFNIHQLLTPIESTQVIIAHVPEGVALARKHGLPESFIDVIREHHGTTLVYYFYCKQVEQMGGDTEAVDESKFRYPGPKPRSKESAIIMIADTIEAASRSMDEVSEESLTEMVDRLIGDKAREGQFDNCQLTFEELGIVKRTIVKTLAVTRHLRIKYPKR